MYRDKQEELERLEKELLAEEEPENEEDMAEAFEEEEDFAIGDAPAVYQNYSNNYGKDLRNFASGYQAYNADKVDTDIEEFSQEVLEDAPASAPLWIPVLLTVLIAVVVIAIVWIVFGVGGLK